MFKNVASQKIEFFAFDYSTGAPKTGDAANITAYVAKDFGSVTVLGDTSATEADATNAKGCYVFDLTQAETNADHLMFTAKSSTANVSVVPRFIETFPNRFTTLVIDSSGLADANAVKIGPTGAGTAQTARDLGTSVLISSGTGTGQLSVTSGVIAANVTQFGGSAGTFSGGRPEVNATSVNGSATAGANLALAFNDTAGASPWTGIADQGTAQSASATTVTLRSAAAFGDNALQGMVIAVFGSTQAYWQAGAIESNVGSTDVVTVAAAFAVTPSGTITYKIFMAPPGTSSATLIKAVTDKLNTMLESAPGSPGEYRFTADALERTRIVVGMAAGNLDTQLAALQSDTDNIQTRLPAALGANGNIKADVRDFNGTAGTFASGRAEVNTTHIAGSAVSTSLAQIGVNVVNAAGTAWNSGAIGAPTLATDTITAAKIAADAIGASELAADAVAEIQSGLATAAVLTAASAILAKLDSMLEVGPGSPSDYRLSRDAVQQVQATLGVASANLDTQLANLLTSVGTRATPAQVNAEVVDALNVDTYAEPGQAAPSATATLAAKLNYLYKAWLNKKTQTASTFSLFDNSGATVDQKATVSDDGTTTTVGKIGTGP